jgi:hypothetical protein
MAQRPAFPRFAGNERGRWKLSLPGAIESRSVFCSLRRRLIWRPAALCGPPIPGRERSGGSSGLCCPAGRGRFQPPAGWCFPATRKAILLHWTGQRAERCGSSRPAARSVRRYGACGRWKGICGYCGRKRIVCLWDCLSGCSILICISARHRASLIFCFVGLRPVSRRACF